MYGFVAAQNGVSCEGQRVQEGLFFFIIYSINNYFKFGR